jgi:plasmid stabilization system protein ParE
MSYELVFQRHVREDIDDAFTWYENQQVGLGERFLAELERVFERLTHSPAIHQMIFENVRRTTLRRFPYSVFYQIQLDRVEIIAVQHGRRNPDIGHLEEENKWVKANDLLSPTVIHLTASTSSPAPRPGTSRSPRRPVSGPDPASSGRRCSRPAR